MYYNLTYIAEMLVNKIDQSGKFKKVCYTQATNGTQVYKEIENLVNLPIAVVAIGNIDYDLENLSREIEVIVFVIDSFKKSQLKAQGVWELSESVADEFLEENMLKDIEVTLQSCRTVESDDNVSAFSISLSCLEFQKEEL